MRTPVLPKWFPRRELSRPTAEQIDRTDNRKRTLTYAGQNAVIPIVYGEQLVSGPIIAGPVHYSGAVFYAVALCWAGEGGIEKIEDVRLGEEVTPIPNILNVNAPPAASVAGAQVYVYEGRQTAPSTHLVDAIPGFDDVFEGLAYAVVRAFGTDFTSLPQLAFRIKGRKTPKETLDFAPLPMPFEPNDLGRNQGSPFMATIVGDGGRSAYSLDLETWTEATPFPSGADILVLGTHSNSNLIAGTSGGDLFTSGNTSNLNWTSRTLPFSGSPITAARKMHGDPSVAAVADGAGRVATSSNMSTWTQWWGGLFGGSAVYALAHAGQGLFAGGADGKLARGTSTSNGVLLDSKFGASTIRCAVLMGTGNINISDTARLVLLGDDGKVSWTADGTDFYAADAGFGSANITHAVYANGFVVALSDDGQMRVSRDGERWAALPLSTDTYRKLFAAGDHLVVVDADGDAFKIEADHIDPFTWSENPALHMLDFVTNNEFGMGANLIGYEAAAAVADSFYSGLPRIRTGMTIQDSMPAEDILSRFALCAEVLWSYDGRDVVIVPDAPVDTVHPIEVGAIIEDSLRLTTADLSQIPTQIRLMFSDREEPTWASRPAVAQVPEHSMHGMPQSPSSVSIPEVYNRVEAERRAWTRLFRLQTPGRIEWQMTAAGMPYQAGDVVRLPDRLGLQSVEVRLTAQPTMIAPLKYQMVGEIYSRSHYPVGAEGVAVPVGAILMLRGSGDVPEGWAPVSISNRLISEGAPGNAGTEATYSESFLLEAIGNHSGDLTPAFEQVHELHAPGSHPDLSGPTFFNGGTSASGNHNHFYNVFLQSQNIVPTRQVRFVRNVSAPGMLPPGVAFLSGNIGTPDRVMEAIDLAGGYLAGGTVEASRPGTTSHFGVSSAQGGHRHGGETGRTRNNTGDLERAGWVGRITENHEHACSGTIEATLRSVALAMFESLGEALIPEGGIVGWDGGEIPSGWALCDGNNGTVDLTDRFIYLTAAAQAGVEHEADSEMVLRVTSVSSVPGHNHGTIRMARNRTISPAGSGRFLHTNSTGGHSHPVDGGPRVVDLQNIHRYQLRFIQYLGE